MRVNEAGDRRDIHDRTAARAEHCRDNGSHTKIYAVRIDAHYGEIIRTLRSAVRALGPVMPALLTSTLIGQIRRRTSREGLA